MFGGFGMKIHTEKVELLSEKPTELVNVTTLVKETLAKSGVRDGVLHIFTTHTTTALTINENEPGLERDIVALLMSIVREDGDYHHHHFFYKDGRMAVNAWAHLRNILLGSTLSIPVAEGRALLGERQNVYFVELDGPQERTIFIQVMGE